MSDYPESWVEKAADGLAIWCPRLREHERGSACHVCKKQARAVLDAVAPTIRAEDKAELDALMLKWRNETVANNRLRDGIRALADEYESQRKWNLDHREIEGDIGLGYVARSLRALLNREVAGNAE